MISTIKKENLNKITNQTTNKREDIIELFSLHPGDITVKNPYNGFTDLIEALNKSVDNANKSKEELNK